MGIWAIARRPGGATHDTNLAATAPITLDDNATDKAKNIGKALGDGDTVCASNNICTFKPPASELGSYHNASPEGAWRLCVSDTLRLGTLRQVTFVITTD